jgi:DUF1680 family protein/alpha-L-arabinofuranosidase/predicted GH43/DUF377 family glycosyl hydrolase
MKPRQIALIAFAGTFLSGLVCGQVAGRDYPIRPVPFTEVKITDDFWAPRIETNRTVTIPYAFGQCEQTGRIDNFLLAAGKIEGEHKGDFPFDDTDPYKILEGAAYVLNVQPDPKLDAYVDDLIAKIAAAQEPDGYLYTCRTNNCERLRNWFGNKRWEKLAGSHELYNMGHLYEAAAAHYQATGKRNLLDVALKNAELLDSVFGPGKNTSAPGHQVIEMGLVKLYRITGDEKYLNLAKFFLDARGPGGDPYNQSHEKPCEQSEAVGHAVRAAYMYSGMADVAAMTGDERYLQAIDRIWADVVSKKLYLTGGIGATGHGEAFGGPYELPNETAYCETCAAIGNVYWNHRMFLFHGDARYIDVMERTLYNGVISGVSLEGNRFFYPNPLASHGQHERSPWFGCACCPGNIARFIASVPGYVYAQTDDELYVNLFAQGPATIKLGDRTVYVLQETDYPWSGKIKLTISPEPAGRFAVCVRIPGWAQGRPVPSDLYQYRLSGVPSVDLTVDGKRQEIDIHKGYVRLERQWKTGDVVELNLPMPIRRVITNETVEANVGRVAIERGPLVYCLEWPDNEGGVFNLVLNDDAPLMATYRDDLLGGVTVVRGKAKSLRYASDGQTLLRNERDIVAIPYYAWAHRGPGEMAVWLARTEEAAEPTLPEDLLRNASFERSDGTLPASWEQRTYGGQARFRHTRPGRTDERCAMIESATGADAGWFAMTRVRPFSRYRLSGWICTENLDAGTGRGALLNVHDIQGVQTQAVTGTADWTKVETEFDTGPRSRIGINCLFGGWGQSTGKAWFDDIQLERLGEATDSPGRPAMYYTDDSYERPFAKDPDVVRFQGRYLMYYSIDRGKDGFAVGIAESSDLTNWEKVGEVLPEAEYERNGLAAPGAMVRDGKVHLFYQTYGNGRDDAICHAVSDDGLHFTRNASNPIFRPEGDWNCGRAIDADVIQWKDFLLLYCATRDPAMKVQKLVAAAAPIDSDWGRDKWTQLCDTSILEPQLPWEGQCIEAPSVIERDGKLYMFYAGAYNNSPQQIGCAASTDGVSWTRLSRYPLLPNGSANEWNASESGHPGVFQDDDGQTYLFFQGNNDNGASWYLSKMKVTWDEAGFPLLVRPRDGRAFRIKESIKPVVAIDAGARGEPISKYVYGQFIEHLGRCIYGGIWAEMLEDRKFFYPVGHRPSAWETTGSTTGLVMDRTDPFVGEHTPVIHTASGIRQRGLGVVAGRQYSGYIWIKPQSASGVNVEVSLVWGNGRGQRETNFFTVNAEQYIQCPLRFTPAASTDEAALEIRVMRGAASIGTVSLMPADNIDGMRADTLKLLKELDAPVYRWPGGNFVSGYNWRDGVGPRDRRPPRKNPAWQGIEHNDFGLDEFLRFCKEIGTEPMIAVNSGFGDDFCAAQEVQYANGSAETPMGRWRAENGHPEPYDVTWWCVGNEMYGSWQLGHMALEQYVIKHNLFARAMRAVDPDIKLIGVGAVGSWSQGMLENCAETMDLISEHFYRQEREPVADHVQQIPDAVRSIADAHRRYREQLDSLAGKDIRIALDEWNYWYGPHVFGELGTRYFQKDALGIAAGLHEMARNSDLYFMANYAQTVNVIGAIKTTRTAAAIETTGLVLKLYRHHFGTVPVAVSGKLHGLDVAAAWTADKKAITIGIVNPTEAAYDVTLMLEGASLTGNGRCWTIAHDDPMAYNEPGQAPKVAIKEDSVSGLSDTLDSPAYSVRLYELEVR